MNNRGSSHVGGGHLDFLQRYQLNVQQRLVVVYQGELYLLRKTVADMGVG